MLERNGATNMRKLAKLRMARARENEEWGMKMGKE